MKLYYLCPFEATRHISCEWHGIDLENGTWLICVRWRNDAEEEKFAAMGSVLSLPHPIFGASEKLGVDHVRHLEKTMRVNQSHTVHDVIREAGKLSPMLKLRVL